MEVIVTEMARGNFSFLILIVGIIQCFLMIRNTRKNKDNDKDDKE